MLSYALLHALLDDYKQPMMVPELLLQLINIANQHNGNQYRS